MKEIKIAPSLLAADFANLEAEVKAVEKAGADFIHLDVMDGHFVPNITIGPGVIKALRPHTRLPFDVHLMISPADPYIEAFAKAGADIITVHPEAGPHIQRTLQLIRSFDKKAGLALNPGTSEGVLDYLLDDLDLILVMTVNPGFGGQHFLASQTEKIHRIKDLIGTRPILLEVDGGITPETAPAALSAGADVLVAGTAVFHTKEYKKNIRALRGYS